MTEYEKTRRHADENDDWEMKRYLIELNLLLFCHRNIIQLDRLPRLALYTDVNYPFELLRALLGPDTHAWKIPT